MNKHYTLLLLSGTYLISQSANAALVRDRRCDTWNDSLSGPEAHERIAFTLSCEKDPRILREVRTSEKGVIAKDGSTGAGYPSYGKYNDNISDYENPLNWFAPPKKHANCSEIPPGYEVAFYCAAGCYTPDQVILSDAGAVEVGQASAMNLSSVKTLTEDSSMENLKYKFSNVVAYISDAVPGLQTIRRFTMLSGGELRVTSNHPLVNASGEVAQAQSFKAGDALVKADGQLDPILSVDDENYFGKVYNLRMSSEDLKENILVAQGYLNGSVRYQNEYVKQLNRQLLRTVVASRFLHK